MNFKLGYLILTLILMCGALSYANFSYAEKSNALSSNEDVALAFYKVAGTKPDFKKWALKADAYRYKSVTEAPNFIIQENERLTQKWMDISKNGTAISSQISTNVIVKMLEPKTKTEKPKYSLHILIDNPEKMYLPFKHQDTNFAIIADNIQNVLTHTINEASVGFILKDLGLNSKKQVNIELDLQPYKAYTEKPENIDNMDQWILMSKIVRMKIISKKTKTVLWHYDAPWYVSPKRQELNDVFENKREDVKKANESMM